MRLIHNIFAIVCLGVFLLASQGSFATHVIGGEIYFECIQTGPDAGKFKFFVKIYKDCSVNQLVNPNGQFVRPLNHPTITADIPLTLVSQADLSPVQCGFDCASQQVGTIEEYIFETAPVTIDGVPPAGGFEFAYFQCCRTTSNNLANPTTEVIAYKAIMHPYQGQDLNPCFDSSPAFATPPSSLLCSGYEFNYNGNAIDPDLDSISYTWASPLGNPNPPGTNDFQPVTFLPGYSLNLPLPNPAIDPSYDIVDLDEATGTIEYETPNGLIGRWNLTLNVHSWRCNSIISTVTRELTIETIACAEPNSIPQVAPPIIAQPAGQSGYSITVNAGDPVQFDLSSLDPDLDAAGNAQTITMTASGSQFGAGFNNAAAGCPFPPCATLSNVTPPQTNPSVIGTTFNWQTDCDHVAVVPGCAVRSTTYNFVFTFTDNHCPTPGVNHVNVSVTVIASDILPSPEPRCVSVQANGDIVVNWIPIVDTSVPPSFSEYSIQHSTSPTGPFTEVGIDANINANSFTHTAASASPPIGNGPNYYVIRTRSGCGGNQTEAAVDTVSSIYLTVTDNGELASLDWTPHATPPLASSNGNGLGLYQVYKEYPIGSPAQIIGTTFDTFYEDPIDVCGEAVNYWIELTDNMPCTSVSNVSSQVLTNTTLPADQFLDSVSVDIGGHAIAGWQASSSLDVVEYNVQINVNDGVNPPYWSPTPPVVSGLNNTFWQNPDPTAVNESECYRVSTTDACDNDGLSGSWPDGSPDRQCTMVMEVSLDTCARTNILSWIPYTYWPEGVKEYEVLMSKNSQPELKIAIMPDSVFTYEHANLQLQADYCYRIRAVRNTATRITSSTAPKCSYVFVSNFPDVNYISSVTIPNNDEVLVHFFVDSTAGITSFDIKRGKEPEEISRIGSMPFTPSKREYTYLDVKALPDFRPYYYRVTARDACGEIMDSTQTAKTILLEATANSDRTNTLVWNSYEGWPDGIEQYNVYRNINGTWEYQVTLPPTTLTYTDDVLNIIDSDGNFCYYIEAQEFGPLLLGDPLYVFDETSLSNVACAPQYPNVFVPNAFTPSGLNKIFKPVTVYVDFDDYQFTVMNRWGGIAFQTNDINQGWDGNLKGSKPAPQGVYGYNVQYIRADGVAQSKVGTVVLYR